MGKAVACDESGVPSFDHIRYRRHDSTAFLYAFDLIELNGDDLRRDPLEVRKATLANSLARAERGIWFNDHIEEDGPTVFRHACKLGLDQTRVTDGDRRFAQLKLKSRWVPPRRRPAGSCRRLFPRS
jgi:hypothetical protein